MQKINEIDELLKMLYESNDPCNYILHPSKADIVAQSEQKPNEKFRLHNGKKVQPLSIDYQRGLACVSPIGDGVPYMVPLAELQPYFEPGIAPLPEYIPFTASRMAKCTCGLEAANAGGKHSSWCDKFSQEDL